MTKWKCEGCRHRCSIETNAHTPMLFCGMGLLEWMKVETAEEWLDLEEMEEKNCLDCVHYPNTDPNDATCYECLDTWEMSGFSPKFSPKAKPDTKCTHIFSTYIDKNDLCGRIGNCIKCGEAPKHKNELEERIKQLEDENRKRYSEVEGLKGFTDAHQLFLENHKKRIEKLEIDDDALSGYVKELIKDVEELKKKAHEHPTTFEDKSWTSTTGQCLHEWSNKSTIIRCVKCGMPKVEAMYPSPRWE